MTGLSASVFLATLATVAAQATSACANVASYYSGITGTTGATLRSQLHNLIDAHNIIPYSSSGFGDAYDALENIDRIYTSGGSPTNTVRTIYSFPRTANLQYDNGNGWNREHSWPKSLNVGETGADTSDLHALFASDVNVNSARGNKRFCSCGSTCNAGLVHPEADPTAKENAACWMPPTDRRGDIARAQFYMDVRYDGSDGSTVDLKLDNTASSSGNLADLLAWHAADPPDAFERRRNGFICTGLSTSAGYFNLQRNRNPFVDRPEWVRCIFANDCSGVTPSSSASPPPPSPSPPPLSSPSTTGDVAIIGFNSDDPDRILIVALANLPAGRQYKFTDNGWYSSGGFRTGEGVFTWTVPSGGRSAGTTTLLAPSGVALSTSGDQIYVYTGADTAPAFSYAIQFGGTTFSSTASSSTTGALPASLSLGSSAVAVGNVDNGRYNRAITVGTKAQLLAAISNPSNWQTSSSPLSFNTAGFTVL